MFVFMAELVLVSQLCMWPCIIYITISFAYNVLSSTNNFSICNNFFRYLNKRYFYAVLSHNFRTIELIVCSYNFLGRIMFVLSLSLFTFYKS
jgi:hypothetical protein